VICAIKSNRTLGEKKLSQWPHALRHQRYQRVQLPVFRAMKEDSHWS
jgi:hypothetical protein